MSKTSEQQRTALEEQGAANSESLRLLSEQLHALSADVEEERAQPAHAAQLDAIATHMVELQTHLGVFANDDQQART